jgi:hypothetical protein
MEYETKNAHFPNGISEAATHCDGCDEESVCNCENNERITPYFGHDQWIPALVRTEKKTVSDHCKTFKSRCQNMASRLKKDWKACGKNPYIKQKASCRIELYRAKQDTQPIDSFEAKSEKSYPLRTVALLGIGVLIAAYTVKFLFKK